MMKTGLRTRKLGKRKYKCSYVFVSPFITGTSSGIILDHTYFRYSIIGGDGASNFTIDAIYGKIDPLGIIDFESIPQNSGDDKHFSPRYIRYYNKS